MAFSTPRRALRPLLLVLAACSGFHVAHGAEVVMPRFTHPGAGQTLYFVLTDRFANGDPANDRGGLTGGADQTGFDPSRISHFHGGDFAGMLAHLDYLQGLGVTAIWVTPPFRNKPVQNGTAGYHGYWILDFLHIDPHLGTDAEFAEFVRQAHARGLRVYMDIIVNHTADVIQLESERTYRDRAAFPYRDARGQPFDERVVAFNGLNDPSRFPALAAATSFPSVPNVPAAETGAKNPDWLNDVTLYHNRGNSTFAGESATLGDFAGLDDVFTEQPRVVEGFIDIFSRWIAESGVDGFRIDTARHVNAEFWQAFSPAIRAKAREHGRPDFLQFAEVYNEAGDPALLAEFSTSTMPIDTTIDFGFFAAARRFVSQAGTAAALADFFARDDFYTDHDSNVHSTTTFLGNHDAGRFAYFLQQDNPGAPAAQLSGLDRLGHALLLLSRGQPVLYYGDEQGMIGRGGGDMQAREDMFAAQAPAFTEAALLATARTGADDKFDTAHPFYRLFARLNALRAAHPALRTGAMVTHLAEDPSVFAFSRIDRRERVEYLVALNNSRARTVRARVATSQPAGARLEPLFNLLSDGDAAGGTLEAGTDGSVVVSLEPMQCVVWRATAPLAARGNTEPLAITITTPAAGATLTFSAREVDGLTFPTRREIRAEVTGSDSVAEVTFVMMRRSRPGQFEWLGTDDAPPYRVFWNPPADLAPDDVLTFSATVDDLRGRRRSAELGGLTVAPNSLAFGITGASVPTIKSSLPPRLALRAGEPLHLHVEAGGTPPLEFQWLRDDAEIPGATEADLVLAAPSEQDRGRYRVLVRNRAGTVLSTTATVE